MILSGFISIQYFIFYFTYLSSFSFIFYLYFSKLERIYYKDSSFFSLNFKKSSRISSKNTNQFSFNLGIIWIIYSIIESSSSSSRYRISPIWYKEKSTSVHFCNTIPAIWKFFIQFYLIFNYFKIFTSWLISRFLI